MNKHSLSTNEELRQKDCLTSVNGKYKAVFQSDSNFVIYDDTATWHADTANSTGTRLLLQSDGNLVMYTEDKRCLWFTGEFDGDTCQMMRLTLTDQGNLEIDRDGQQIWTSANSSGQKP